MKNSPKLLKIKSPVVSSLYLNWVDYLPHKGGVDPHNGGTQISKFPGVGPAKIEFW